MKKAKFINSFISVLILYVIYTLSFIPIVFMLVGKALAEWAGAKPPSYSVVDFFKFFFDGGCLFYIPIVLIFVYLFYIVYDLSASKVIIYLFFKDIKSLRVLFLHNINLSFFLQPIIFAEHDNSIIFLKEVSFYYPLSFMCFYTIAILLFKFFGFCFRDTNFSKMLIKRKLRIYGRISRKLLRMYFLNKKIRDEVQEDVSFSSGIKNYLIECLFIALFFGTFLLFV